jgi:hypothetical protein
MKIQCVDRDVHQILESGTYVIPRFQRPFSWDRENVEDFWSDCVEEIKSDYFIGAFVTYNLSSSSYGIVDGQQRLTTITIFLCALRDVYMRHGYSEAAKGVHRLIETRDLEDQSQFVLKAQSSYPYLQAKIQSFPQEDEEIDIAEEEKALKLAYEIIEENIAKEIDELGDAKLMAVKKKIKKWIDSVRDKVLSLKLISITLDNLDDANTIFETLNTRGKDLTAADLAKNHFLSLMPLKGKSLDRPMDHWLEIQAEFERSKKQIPLTTFLHHYWLSKHSFTTVKELFKAIRTTVNASNAKVIMTELRSDSVLYRGITEPNSLEFWGKATNDIRDSLSFISNILNITIANPLLLTVLRLYQAKRLKDGQVREIFSIVEKYHYICTTICMFPSSGGLCKMYAAHARAFENAATPSDMGQEIADFKKKMRNKIPPKNIFMTKFVQLSYANVRQRDVLRYTLWKIDKTRNAAIDLDRDSSSFEHLLSQSSKADLIQNIGNLILVPVKFNGEKLRDKPFGEKKILLEKGGYPLDAIIKAADKWAGPEIVARNSELAEYAYASVWAIK